MTLQRIVLSATAAAASAFAFAASPALADGSSPPATPTNVPVASSPYSPTAPYFVITDEEPGDSSVIAQFGANINKKNDKIPVSSADYFNDSFSFTLPVAGTGSGSLSTSFSGLSNELDITGVSIDGVNYTSDLSTTKQAKGGGEDLDVANIPISAFELNTIDVQGYLLPGASAGSFDGTATFVASATPEPATWLLMIGGLGFIGAVLRRRQGTLRFA